MMLAASAVMFGSFLLSSLYLQNVLGTGALATGLAFLPLATAIVVGVHLANHLIHHAGVRVPLAAGFAVTAAGMLLLSGVDAGGSYLADVLPGMLVAGVGLGVVLVRGGRRRAHRRERRRGRDALGPEHDRPRNRRLDRDRRARHDRRRLHRRAGRRRCRPRGRDRQRVPCRWHHRRRVLAHRAGRAPVGEHFLPKLRLAPRVAVH